MFINIFRMYSNIEHGERRSGRLNVTSELQPPELEGDEAVADLDEVDEGVEVVRSQDETVSGAVVAPSTQHEVPAQ